MDIQQAESFSPELITDLKKIESLANQNYQANLDFVQFLKTQNPDSLDVVVKEISTTVAAGIDCMKCANCCKALIVAPDYRDISELASHLEMTSVDFKKKYMKKDFEGEMVMKQKPCPFLKNNMCSVYASRPGLCRNYPYLDKGQILANITRFMNNTFVCPIAFNTFELLKLRFT